MIMGPKRITVWFGLCALVIFAASPARAACTSPAATAGSVQWFSAISRHLYCDGNGWRDFSADYWLRNPTNTADIYYSSEVGIKTTTPVVPLDVAGSIRLGYTAMPCSSWLTGALRYDPAVKTYSYCDGLSWKGFVSGTIPPDNCEPVTFSSPGNHSYTVLTGCTDLLIETWGAGGGGAYNGQGGGGGGSSRVEDDTATILVMAGGGGGGGYDFSVVGGGGGGGYARKTLSLTAGDELRLFVGEGGQSACMNDGGEGGEQGGGRGGSSSGVGSASTHGGGGGGDSGARGGSSTNGGAGGGGSGSGNASTTTYGGAGGSDFENACGTSTNGGTCGGHGEGGGGGSGTGDIVLNGLSGDRNGAGATPQSGPGTGAAGNTFCPMRAGNGQIKITPVSFVTPQDCSTVTFSAVGNYLYQVPATCNTLVIDAYGAGGGGAYNGQGGGGGGASRVEDNTATILVLAGGGGGGGYDPSRVGGGGGGGYARKTTGALTVGSYLLVVVGEGGGNACNDVGGEGGEINPGLGGDSGLRGGDSVHGGGGGGDFGARGGSSTNGGGGGGGSGVNNGASTTTYGGAGGADKDQTCGVSTFGGACSGTKEGGGGGGGIGDTVTLGSAGSNTVGGAAANSGPGTGGGPNFACPSRGGNGRVVIDPQ